MKKAGKTIKPQPAEKKKFNPRNTIKKKGGRPPLFSSVKVLQDRIEEYFDFCDSKTKEIWSEKLGHMIVADPAPYTMSGLAYWLELDRHTLVNYSHTEKFFTTVKKARVRVESQLDERMNNKDTFTPGQIFTAKNNFNWKEKVETEHSGEVKLWKEEPPK